MMENKTKIDLKNKSVFITGVAGFIGSNLAGRLLSTVEGVKVVGLDNMNHYYDVRLKEARLNELEQFENFSFVKGNLADKAVIESIFEQYKPEIVVNLGAQAGVRYSITNPDAYVEANLIGFYNILEACRHSYDEGHTPVEHLVYASSSSVYMEIAARLTELLTCLMEDAWKPEPERNGSAKRLSLTRVRSYIREMEARCRPRIAIPFSTGCAAPFQGRLFADRRGNLPMRYGRGETAA